MVQSERFKTRIRAITLRIRGRTFAGIIEELRTYILGWKAYIDACRGAEIVTAAGGRDAPPLQSLVTVRYESIRKDIG